MTERPDAPQTPADVTDALPDIDALPEPYRVLARKYRPRDFSELIGQDVLVRTLKNAITSGRIAQAYMLTGVRGVGKTTTARIIARALNCIGPDGQGGPTVTPCGQCVHCLAIAEDRHVDVLELDAASRTGVDDMRELLDGVRYKPTQARFKIYIIDEVHMLSMNAFNALLKTLEEPPEHVKFVFATTEIRKVPVTVLSRCQKFDLRRVGMDELSTHFARIAAKEGAVIEDAALALIARAADGSVRDGLSLLDQAISDAGGAGVREDQVKAMLGLADRAVIYDLFTALMKGDIAAALDLLRNQYDAGAAPVVVIQDLLDCCHALTRVRLDPDAASAIIAGETERDLAMKLADGLAMRHLTRAWQMLLKGLAEVRSAPVPVQAAEMLFVRMAYAADLPSPEDAVKAVQAGGGTPAPTRPQLSGPGGGDGGGGARAVSGGAMASAPVSAPQAQAGEALPTSFADAVALFEKHREILLFTHLSQDVHLVSFSPGRMEVRLAPSAPADLPGAVGKKLTEWTATRWIVTVSDAAGEPSLRDQSRSEAESEPLVSAALKAFPGAKIAGFRAREATDMVTDDPEPAFEDDDLSEF